MYGSIAGSESRVLGFDSTATRVETVMAEAPHGTAPSLKGSNIANPMVMIPAGAALLTHVGRPKTDRASRATLEAVFEAVNKGRATSDLGGQSTTSKFTEELIRGVSAKLEVWSALA